MLVVLGDKLHFLAEGVDVPVHELGDGLGVLAPAVAVGLGLRGLLAAWHRAFGRPFEPGLVALADVHGVELLIHGAIPSGA